MTDRSWPRALVCRGCCCGSPSKHPELDHEAQVHAISATVRTRVVGCLGPCSYSNVVLVRPEPGVSVWFGRLNNEILTDELCDWLDKGALEPLPPLLEVYAFTPEKKTAEAEVVELDDPGDTEAAEFQG